MNYLIAYTIEAMKNVSSNFFNWREASGIGKQNVPWGGPRRASLLLFNQQPIQDGH